eukprot:3469654-Amphidinium_carterae.1
MVLVVRTVFSDYGRLLRASKDLERIVVWAGAAIHDVYHQLLMRSSCIPFCYEPSNVGNLRSALGSAQATSNNFAAV